MPSSASEFGQHVGLGGLEDADELAADDLALLLGVADAGERLEEALLGLDHVQVDARGGDEVALDLLGLALAQQAVVDEHAGEAVPDRTLYDGRGHRRVDTTGQPADRPSGVTDLLADALDLLLDDVHHRPGRPAARDLQQEVLEHPLAVLGVQHLGMPLHPGEAAVGVLEGRHRRRRGRGQDVEALRRACVRSRRATSRPGARGGCRREGCRSW